MTKFAPICTGSCRLGDGKEVSATLHRQQLQYAQLTHEIARRRREGLTPGAMRAEVGALAKRIDDFRAALTLTQA